MSIDSIYLKFSYADSENSDSRTFSIYRVPDPSYDPYEGFELYKFFHPPSNSRSGITMFYRKNIQSEVFETAGQIEWLAPFNAILHIGIDEIPIGEFRRAKKASSKSRRFKARGSEYKWKISESSNADLYCVDLRGRVVATWSQERLLLGVATRLEAILDRIVVTCLLNMWFRKNGRW